MLRVCSRAASSSPTAATPVGKARPGMRLKEKVAVVTGGAKGIGAAICKRYTLEGARVAVADILEDEANATAAAIGGGAFAVPLDVAKRASIDEMVRKVVATAGGIDILVN